MTDADEPGDKRPHTWSRTCSKALRCEAIGDLMSDCASRAAKGECEKNPASMLSLCPQACGTCHELEKFSNAKDEM